MIYLDDRWRINNKIHNRARGDYWVRTLEAAQLKKYCLVDKLIVSLILNLDLEQIIFFV